MLAIISVCKNTNPVSARHIFDKEYYKGISCLHQEQRKPKADHPLKMPFQSLSVHLHTHYSNLAFLGHILSMKFVDLLYLQWKMA